MSVSFGLTFQNHLSISMKVLPIPDEISWRFRLYSSPEKDSPTWAGRFDEITAKMENVEVQARFSNSKTEKLGPNILRSNIKYCK